MGTLPPIAGHFPSNMYASRDISLAPSKVAARRVEDAPEHSAPKQAMLFTSLSESQNPAANPETCGKDQSLYFKSTVEDPVLASSRLSGWSARAQTLSSFSENASSLPPKPSVDISMSSPFPPSAIPTWSTAASEPDTSFLGHRGSESAANTPDVKSSSAVLVRNPSSSSSVATVSAATSSSSAAATPSAKSRPLPDQSAFETASNLVYRNTPGSARGPPAGNNRRGSVPGTPACPPTPSRTPAWAAPGNRSGRPTGLTGLLRRQDSLTDTKTLMAAGPDTSGFSAFVGDFSGDGGLIGSSDDEDDLAGSDGGMVDDDDETTRRRPRGVPAAQQQHYQQHHNSSRTRSGAPPGTARKAANRRSSVVSSSSSAYYAQYHAADEELVDALRSAPSLHSHGHGHGHGHAHAADHDPASSGHYSSGSGSDLDTSSSRRLTASMGVAASNPNRRRSGGWGRASSASAPAANAASSSAFNGAASDPAVPTLQQPQPQLQHQQLRPPVAPGGHAHHNGHTNSRRSSVTVADQHQVAAAAAATAAASSSSALEPSSRLRARRDSSGRSSRRSSTGSAHHGHGDGATPTPVSFERDFITIRSLGSGGFSTVVEAEYRRDGRRYAVKRAQNRMKSRRERNLLLREFRTFLRVGPHPHLVHYAVAWQEGGYLWFATELCRGGTWKGFTDEYGVVADTAASSGGGDSHMTEDAGSHPSPVPEHSVWTFIAHVSSCLAHMHARGVVHLDIKPENVLISSTPAPSAAAASSSSSAAWPVLKVGDLGLATEYHNPTASSASASASSILHPPQLDSSGLTVDSDDDLEGDSRYMALELLSHGNRLPPADIFSLGLSAFEMAWDVAAPREGQAWRDVREGRLPPLPPHMATQTSNQLTGLIVDMMRPDPAARPTADQILAHPLVAAALAQPDPALQQHLARRATTEVVASHPGPIVRTDAAGVAHGHWLGRSESFRPGSDVGDGAAAGGAAAAPRKARPVAAALPSLSEHHLHDHHGFDHDDMDSSDHKHDGDDEGDDAISRAANATAAAWRRSSLPGTSSSSSAPRHLPPPSNGMGGGCGGGTRAAHATASRVSHSQHHHPSPSGRRPRDGSLTTSSLGYVSSDREIDPGDEMMHHHHQQRGKHSQQQQGQRGGGERDRADSTDLGLGRRGLLHFGSVAAIGGGAGGGTAAQSSSVSSPPTAPQQQPFQHQQRPMPVDAMEDDEALFKLTQSPSLLQPQQQQQEYPETSPTGLGGAVDVRLDDDEIQGGDDLDNSEVDGNGNGCVSGDAIRRQQHQQRQYGSPWGSPAGGGRSGRGGYAHANDGVNRSNLFDDVDSDDDGGRGHGRSGEGKASSLVDTDDRDLSYVDVDEDERAVATSAVRASYAHHSRSVLAGAGGGGAFHRRGSIMAALNNDISRISEGGGHGYARDDDEEDGQQGEGKEGGDEDAGHAAVGRGRQLNFGGDDDIDDNVEAVQLDAAASAAAAARASRRLARAIDFSTESTDDSGSNLDSTFGSAAAAVVTHQQAHQEAKEDGAAIYPAILPAAASSAAAAAASSTVPSSLTAMHPSLLQQYQQQPLLSTILASSMAAQPQPSSSSGAKIGLRSARKHPRDYDRAANTAASQFASSSLVASSSISSLGSASDGGGSDSASRRSGASSAGVGFMSPVRGGQPSRGSSGAAPVPAGGLSNMEDMMACMPAATPARERLKARRRLGGGGANPMASPLVRQQQQPVATADGEADELQAGSSGSGMVIMFSQASQGSSSGSASGISAPYGSPSGAPMRIARPIASFAPHDTAGGDGMDEEGDAGGMGGHGGGDLEYIDPVTATPVAKRANVGPSPTALNVNNNQQLEQGGDGGASGVMLLRPYASDGESAGSTEQHQQQLDHEMAMTAARPVPAVSSSYGHGRASLGGPVPMSVSATVPPAARAGIGGIGAAASVPDTGMHIPYSVVQQNQHHHDGQKPLLATSSWSDAAVQLRFGRGRSDSEVDAGDGDGGHGVARYVGENNVNNPPHAAASYTAHIHGHVASTPAPNTSSSHRGGLASSPPASGGNISAPGPTKAPARAPVKQRPSSAAAAESDDHPDRYHHGHEHREAHHGGRSAGTVPSASADTSSSSSFGAQVHKPAAAAGSFAAAASCASSTNGSTNNYNGIAAPAPLGMARLSRSDSYPYSTTGSAAGANGQAADVAIGFETPVGSGIVMDTVHWYR